MAAFDRRSIQRFFWAVPIIVPNRTGTPVGGSGARDSRSSRDSGYGGSRFGYVAGGWAKSKDATETRELPRPRIARAANS